MQMDFHQPLTLCAPDDAFVQEALDELWQNCYNIDSHINYAL